MKIQKSYKNFPTLITILCTFNEDSESIKSFELFLSKLYQFHILLMEIYRSKIFELLYPNCISFS